MCDAVQQDLCVCRPQPINHCGNKIWKCQTHNSSCKKSQGSASTLLMCRYLCLSSCWKNKARICANNRNEWLSKGKPPPGSISCRHSVVCFHFPFSVSVVQLVCVTAPVSIVSDQWLKAVWAWTLLLWRFPVLSPWSSRGASLKFIAQLRCPRVHSRTKHGWVTHNPPCFSFPTARLCVPCGYTFWKELTISCLEREKSPRRTVLRVKL